MNSVTSALGTEQLDAQDSASNLSGLAKASILLISLGAANSSAVLQHLNPDEIERLTAEIVRQRRVRPEVRKKVVEESCNFLQEEVAHGGVDYAKEVLRQVFGETKAVEMLERASVGGSGMSAARVFRSIPPRQLAAALKDERPQVIALVLGHLPPDHAAQVIQALPEDRQGDATLRLVTMQPTSPEVVRSVADQLLQQTSGPQSAALTEVGGNETVVRILNNVGRSTERRIMEYLGSADPDAANAIKERMFTFDDVISLDDRSIQVILREVPQDDLRLALKGAPGNVKEVFFKNMSQRAAETLKEDLEASGPVKLRDVEAAQNRIVAVARSLDEAGEISLRSSGEDMVV